MNGRIAKGASAPWLFKEIAKAALIKTVR
jgi:hypothetical protein